MTFSVLFWQPSGGAKKSTPNMTGRRFHRTMEMIPSAPGSLKALLFPPLLNNVENKGTQGVRARYGAELRYERGTARNFLHSFPLSGALVVQSYWAWKKAHKLFSHKLSVPPFVPGIVPGTNRVCPRDKPGEIGLPLCKIR